MMEWMHSISMALGLEHAGKDLGTAAMALRAVFVYVASLVLIKCGKRRFMSKATPVDVVMAIVFGSVMSRAINGSATFWPTMAAGLAIVLVYRWLEWATCRWPALYRLLMGDSRKLVSDGRIDWDQMRMHDITESELQAALRKHLHTESMERVKDVYLEANGRLSVVARPQTG